MWRLFRMNVTYCLHQAVNEAETELITVQWQDQPGGALAGGPVEVLDSCGVEDQPSVLPCENPIKIPLFELTGVPDSHPDCWFPEDCGKCAPCQGRAMHEAALGLTPK